MPAAAAGPTRAPPIKSQGIKTRLVPLIRAAVLWRGGRWIEPFVGSGAVLLNIGPPRALAGDSNRHVIAFYRAVQSEAATARIVRRHLEHEGAALARLGEAHYYRVRERFNRTSDPLDFLFLNRSCFNGLIRFNRKGEFNVPFCRKPERFRPAYITKICNQVEWTAATIAGRDWRFAAQDWRATLAEAGPADFVYADPPYVGRHADYCNRWTEADADALARALRGLPCAFAYSMWSENRYRKNPHLARWFADLPVREQRHFYHVGPAESLRNAMVEALVVSHGPGA